MPRQYDIYGFRRTALEDVTSQLGQVLGISLEERDSSYYAGTYYLYRKTAGRTLRIYNNHDPIRNQSVRGQYADYDVILEVSDMEDMDGIRRKLGGISPQPVLLLSKVLPDEELDEKTGGPQP